jgi:hypothetical protein
MPSINYAVSINGAGSSISSQTPRTTDGVDSREISLPVGSAGTLSTRTDNNTGICTVGSGHGVTTDDLVDVYWSGGVHYGMTVTATTSTTISIDVGAGDNLPSAATAIVVTKQVTINASIDGDNLSMIAIQGVSTDPTSSDAHHCDFLDASAASVTAQNFVANTPRVWDIAGGSTNPFTGNVITEVVASNGSSTAALTLKMIYGADSTP